METKQVIVVRQDLKMNHGKMAAQVAHASMGAILSFGKVVEKYNSAQELSVREFHLDLMHAPAMDNWLILGSFTKVCLAVNSEKELVDLHAIVQEHGTINCLIKDSGRTVFSEPTYTCLAIGPGVSDRIDKYTGHLKLY
jgi:PTH2 family peptidyl-tRNA hydrolase